MNNFFRNSSFASFFFLVVLCVLVHFHFFIEPPQVQISEDDGLISMLLIKYIQPLPSSWLFIIYFAVLLFQMILFNVALNSLKMFQQNAFTTSLSYLLITALLPQWCSITPAFIANGLVMWIFVRICKLYNNPSPKTALFNIGLIAGLTVLCYHPTAVLLLLVTFALAVVRPFRITEWLVLLMGFVLPYYFLLSFLFLTNQMNILQRFLPELQFNIPLHANDLWTWINLAGILFFLLIGFYYLSPATDRMVIQIRKNWSVMLVLLLILLPVPFIFKQTGIQSAMLAALPVSAFVSNAFLYPKRSLFPNLLLIIALIIIIHNNCMLIQI